MWIADHGGGEAPRHLVVVLDGQTWVRESPVMSGLHRLSATEGVAPFTVVFVDSVDAARRRSDFTCVESFRSSIIDDLIPWVAARCPLLDHPRTRIVAGQSLGGLAAIDLVLARPDAFGSSIAQSSALWWPTAVHGGGGRWTWVERLADAPSADLRFWLQAGALEADMAELTRRFARDAATAGADVVLDEFCGGHDVVHWRNGLVQGLAELLTEKPEV